MTLNARATIVLLCCSAAPMILSGCEDAAARESSAVQVRLANAANDFQLLRAQTAGSPSDESVQKLNAFAAQVGQIDGGEAGQQAAKAMLAAAALRESASLQLAAADKLEQEHSHRRTILHSHVAGVVRLRSLSDTMNSIDGAAERAELQAALEQARTAMTQYRAQVEELDGPIAEQSAANAESQKEVEALRLKAGELLRRAQELGYADGIELYRQATSTRREMDRIEFDMAQREIVLDYELTPELVMADTHANNLQSMITAVETSIAQIQEFAQSTQADVAAIRAKADALAGEVRTGLQQLSGEMEDQLNSRHTEAQSTLEKAASQLQGSMRNVSGEDAQAAKLAALHVQQTLARLHWSRVRGMDEHRLLLERAKEAGIGQSSALESEIQALASSRSESIELARSALMSAQELAAQVQSRTHPGTMESLNRQIEAALHVMDNKPLSAHASSSAASSSTSSGTSSGATSAPAGAESPEALVAILKSANGPEGMFVMFDLIAPTDQIPGISPGQKAFLDSMRDFSSAMRRLESELQSKFGQGLGEQMSAAQVPGAQLPDLSSVTLKSVEGDRGIVQVPSPSGGTHDAPITKINGRWYLDSKALGLDGGAGAASNPQMQQAADGMMMQMSQMFSKMASIYNDLATAVQNDEYDSYEAFTADAAERFKPIQDSFMGGMGGMMGGMPPK